MLRAVLTIFIAVILISPILVFAHQSGCHAKHSCPSDSGTYVCGDTGYCSQCPDNQFCSAGQLRSQTGSAATSSGTAPSSPAPSPKTSNESPHITAIAGDNVTVVAGSAAEFKGNATGIDGKPLNSARFWWNFGDGETADGRAVLHTFKIPGKYTVGLHVSSGEYAASDFLVAEVVSNQISAGSVLLGENGFLRLVNSSDVELDLGGWIIEDSASGKFTIPVATKIGSKGDIAFANSVTGLFKKTTSGKATLRYPNLSEVGSWDYEPSSPTINVKSQPEIRKVETASVESSERKMVEETAQVKSDLAQASASGSGSNPFLYFAVIISLLSAAGFFVVKRFFNG